MAVYSTRHVGNRERAAAVRRMYQSNRPGTGQRREFLRRLRWYADLVVTPRLARHLSRTQLDSVRIYAAQSILAIVPGAWRDLASMAQMAPEELPFGFTELDSWRVVLDQMHTRRRLGGGV